MNKRRLIIPMAICFTLLNACSNHEPVDKQENVVETEASDHQYSEFTSEDDQVQFTIAINGSFPEETVKRIEDETIDGYESILELTDQALAEQKEVMIQLEKGQGYSHYSNGVIYLYNVGTDNEFLIHELVHALLGYDFKNAGYFTLDGLAMYVNNQITDTEPLARFGHSSHEWMNYLNEIDVGIPLEALIDPEQSLRINDPRKEGLDRGFFYIQSESFSTYLIEKYGMDAFMKIYNQSDLKTIILQTYGKEIGELEAEWMRFLEGMDRGDIETTVPESFLNQIATYEYYPHR
ncbi:hypothetical protein ACSVDE_12100 [Pseudalkalibacillus sp. Hm43]|uniref:hypothetical protein n=1 Tax=Pseudalkalibacillus sp. Hm43 TaxID=3450742 RepID=UPI003F41F67F